MQKCKEYEDDYVFVMRNETYFNNLYKWIMDFGNHQAHDL